MHGRINCPARICIGRTVGREAEGGCGVGSKGRDGQQGGPTRHRGKDTQATVNGN